MLISLYAAPATRVGTTLRPVDAQALYVQVCLDRAHYSPGEIDGSRGNITINILRKFQADHGLPATGEIDQNTIAALSGPGQVPALISYTITYDDVRGPFTRVPKNIMLQAQLKVSGYESPLEGLGEKHHSSPTLLRKLNPTRVR